MPTRVRPRPIPGEPTFPTPSPPPVEPPPVPETMLGAPTGNTPRLKTGGGGGPWADVNRHDQYHIKYGTKYRVPPQMLKSMEVVESGGQSVQNHNGFPNFGVMQLTYSRPGERQTKWEAVAAKLGLPFREPEGQIAVAAYVLGGHDGDPGTPQEIFLAHYYPTPCLDCPGQDGATPRQYLDDIATLTAIIDAALPVKPPVKPPVVPPRQVTEQDILNIITNAAPGARIGFGYAQRNVGQHIYSYGVGHGDGLVGDEYHPGIDIFVPDETVTNCLFGGTVVCVGEQGTPTWGQGCGYFSDQDGGIGKIEILCDAKATIDGKPYQLKMTYGHMSSAVVRPGQRVGDGERIGRSGVGGSQPHIHLDVEINAPEKNNPQIWHNPGEYHLVNPIPTLINAMGGTLVTPIPTPDPNATTYVAHDLPGSKVPLYLPSWVGFRLGLTPPGSNRQQVPMRPTVTVYHSTNNDNPGTGAWHHAVNWQAKGAPGHPDCPNPATCPIGVHAYVDAKEVVWAIPVNEKAVHSGDWRNDWGIAVERTTNSDQNQAEAENNAMHVHAGLLYAIGKTAVDAMYPHTVNALGHCPRIINKPWSRIEEIVDMRIQRIASWVKAHPR